MNPFCPKHKYKKRTIGSSHLPNKGFINNSLKLFLLLIFICFCNEVKSQNDIYQVKEFTVENGLINDHIKSVRIDQENNIWLLTRLGLVKYNRYNFTKINKVDYTKGYRSMTVDQSGKIWLLKDYNEYSEFKEYNIDIYDPENDELKNIIEVYPTIDSVAHKKNFAKLRSKYDYSITLVMDRVKTKTIHLNQGKWYEHNAGNDNIEISKFDLDPNSVGYVSKDMGTHFSYDFIEDTVHVSKGERQYFATYFDRALLFKYLFVGYPMDEKNPYLHYIISDLDDNVLLKIRFDGLNIVSDGENIIFSSRESIFAYEVSSKILTNVTNQLSSNFDITGIFSVDFRGNEIWVGTNNGLYKIIKTKEIFNSLMKNTDLWFRSINQVDSSIIACGENGLYELDLENGKYTKIGPELDFRDFIEIDENRYISNSYGIALNEWSRGSNPKVDSEIYTPKDISEAKNDYAPINNIKKIGEDDFIISTGNGLYDFDPQERTVNLYPGSENIYFDEVMDSPFADSIFFVRTRLGLYYFDGKHKSLTGVPELENILVNDINQDLHDEAIFWVATKGDGLLIWNVQDKTTDRYTTDDGLMNNNVHSAYQIDDKIWMSTDFGISVFDRSSKSINTITSSNGLFENEFNRNSHLKLNDTMLIFGGVDGITYFNPQKAESAFGNSPLQISGIEYIDSKSGDLKFEDIAETDDVLNVEVRRNQLKLNLVLEPSNEALSNSIRYIVVDHLDQWQYSQNNKVFLEDLPYGENKLLLSRQTGISEWSSNRVVIVNLKTPFYVRPYFYVTGFILLLIGILSVMISQRRKQYLINNRIKKEVNEKTKMLQKRNAELTSLSKLNRRIFSVVGHDLRSPLISFGNINNTYQSLTQESSNKEVVKLGKALEKNSKSLINVVDKMLEWSKVDHDGKNTNVDVLLFNLSQEILELYSQNIIQKNITVNNSIDPYTSINSDYYCLQVILRNLIQNAMKYAPIGSEITLKYSLQEKIGKIKIIDEGPGIEKETIDLIFKKEKLVSTKGSLGEEGLGIGLILSLELIEKIDGRLVFKKYNPTGTIAEIQIPQ